MTFYEAAGNMYRNNFNSKDGGMCGFAWVTITGFNGYKIKGNTKMGRTMKMAGVKQNYRRSFEVWNPSNFPVQSIDILYEGALAYSKVLKRHGFEMALAMVAKFACIAQTVAYMSALFITRDNS